MQQLSLAASFSPSGSPSGACARSNDGAKRDLLRALQARRLLSL